MSHKCNLFNLPPEGCPHPWTFLSHGCYLFLTGSTNWADAKNTCEDLHAHLVKIETEQENEELYNEAVRLNMTGGTWIGLSDIAEERNWVWTDGKRVNFTNWSQYQPDNHANNEDCAELNNYISTGGAAFHPKKWNDLPCNNKIGGAICEINVC